MDKVAQYFSGLGNGNGIISLDVFKEHVATVIKHYPPVNMMRQFWLAARAASRIPNLNSAASARVTRDANNFFHQEVQRLETVIDDPSVTIQDLERVLNTYARLQTVPPSSMLNKLILKTAEKMPDADVKCLARLPAQFVDLGVYPSDEWICRPVPPSVVRFLAQRRPENQQRDTITEQKNSRWIFGGY